MKVKDVLAKLKGFDPESDLLCYCEDEALLSPGISFKLFEIDDISSSEGEKTRLSDHTPSLKFSKSSASANHVLLEITADF